MRHFFFLTGSVLAACLCGTGVPRAADHAFTFRDVGAEAGLFPHLGAIMGHGAAWGDADGDGRLAALTVAAEAPPKAEWLPATATGQMSRGA